MKTKTFDFNVFRHINGTIQVEAETLEEAEELAEEIIDSKEIIFWDVDNAETEFFKV